MIAIALVGLAVLMELGSLALLGEVRQAAAPLDAPRPGIGIPYLALLDGLFLFTLGLIGAGLVVPERVQGRIQGVVTLVVSLLVLLAAVGLIFTAIALLAIMLALLLSPIFGTVAYFAIYADFDRTGASVTLGLIMSLKLGAAVLLLLAHQRFLENKGLVLLVLSSLVVSLIISFLHGLVPRVLVSITDAIGAIVVAIVAVIWAILFLIGSIPSVLKALRFDKGVA